MKRTKYMLHLILAWSISVVSCDTTLNPGYKPFEISTDKLSYTSLDTVIVTIFNPTGYTADVMTCSTKVHYEIFDSTWRYYNTYPLDICRQVRPGWITIQANRSIQDSLPLSSLIFHEGLYRLSVSYRLAAGELRNFVRKISNDFTVRLNR